MLFPVIISMIIPGYVSQTVKLIPNPTVTGTIGEELVVNFSSVWTEIPKLFKLTTNRKPFTIGYVSIVNETCEMTIEDNEFKGRSFCRAKQLTGYLILKNLKATDHLRELKFEYYKDDNPPSLTANTNVYVEVPVKNVTISPSDITTTAGQTIQFNCVTLPPTANITWIKTSDVSDKSEILPANVDTYRTNGITHSVLTFNITKSDNGSQIHCEASNMQVHSKIISSFANLIVNYGPMGSVRLNPSRNHITVIENGILNINCTADCNPKCNIRWKVGGDQYINTSTLFLTALTEKQSGNYACEARNEFEGKIHKEEKSISIAVLSPEEMDGESVPSWEYLAGAIVTIIVVLTVVSGCLTVWFLLKKANKDKVNKDKGRKATKETVHQLATPRLCQAPHKFDGSYKDNILYIPFLKSNLDKSHEEKCLSKNVDCKNIDDLDQQRRQTVIKQHQKDYLFNIYTVQGDGETQTKHYEDIDESDVFSSQAARIWTRYISVSNEDNSYASNIIDDAYDVQYTDDVIEQTQSVHYDYTSKVTQLPSSQDGLQEQRIKFKPLPTPRQFKKQADHYGAGKK